jgi:hypothetical protein
MARNLSSAARPVSGSASKHSEFANGTTASTTSAGKNAISGGDAVQELVGTRRDEVFLPQGLQPIRRGVEQPEQAQPHAGLVVNAERRVTRARHDRENQDARAGRDADVFQRHAGLGTAVHDAGRERQGVRREPAVDEAPRIAERGDEEVESVVRAAHLHPRRDDETGQPDHEERGLAHQHGGETARDGLDSGLQGQRPGPPHLRPPRARARARGPARGVWATRSPARFGPTRSWDRRALTSIGPGQDHRHVHGEHDDHEGP